MSAAPGRTQREFAREELEKERTANAKALLGFARPLRREARR